MSHVKHVEHTSKAVHGFSAFASTGSLARIQHFEPVLSRLAPNKHDPGLSWIVSSRVVLVLALRDDEYGHPTFRSWLGITSHGCFVRMSEDVWPKYANRDKL